jgi:perosamine synthetase
VLATHFFGLPKALEQLSSWCAQRGITLVEDCSHVLFFDGHRPPSTGGHGDFVISSPYKFLPSPDGGVLFAPRADRLEGVKPRPRNYGSEVRSVLRAISLMQDHRRKARQCQAGAVAKELAKLSKGSLSRGNDSTRQESLSADYRPSDEGLASLRISELVWRHADIPEIARRRRDNYRRWSAALSGVAGCHSPFPELPEGCIPYMFPLHIARPDPHFYLLKHFGVPVWRWDSIVASDCTTATDYRLHLLHLPCHQAITKNEMDWMTEVVKAVLNHEQATVS